MTKAVFATSAKREAHNILDQIWICWLIAFTPAKENTSPLPVSLNKNICTSFNWNVKSKEVPSFVQTVLIPV